jgi:hypothetical protein
MHLMLATATVLVVAGCIAGILAIIYGFVYVSRYAGRKMIKRYKREEKCPPDES